MKSLLINWQINGRKFLKGTKQNPAKKKKAGYSYSALSSTTIICKWGTYSIKTWVSDNENSSCTLTEMWRRLLSHTLEQNNHLQYQLNTSLWPVAHSWSVRFSGLSPVRAAELRLGSICYLLEKKVGLWRKSKYIYWDLLHLQWSCSICAQVFGGGQAAPPRSCMSHVHVLLCLLLEFFSPCNLLYVHLRIWTCEVDFAENVRAELASMGNGSS